jgi:hypothetical protein
VQRAVITVDPEGARKRREQAEREHARIRFWRENTGTCALRGTGLPTDEALAATANIEARALEYKAVPIKRPMDILRVMAYLDLINGVPVARRVARARAEDEARAAEADPAGAGEQAARDAELREATRRAREKFREKAREGARAGNAGSGQDPRDGQPDDPGDGPDDRPPGGDGPGGDGPDGSGDGRPPGACPDDTDGSSGFPGWRPGDGGSDHPSPVGDPPGSGSASGGSGDGSAGAGDRGSRGPCPECGGVRGGGGLPLRANLILPAGAIPWLAGRADLRPGSAGSDSRVPGAGANDAAGQGGGPASRGDPGEGGSRGDPGPCLACSRRGSDRLLVRGNLDFPLLTLLRLAERPGEAHGLGALDPGLVRDLAAAGAWHPASEFCVTIVDEQGHAIGHGCGKPLRRSRATASGSGGGGASAPRPTGTTG